MSHIGDQTCKDWMELAMEQFATYKNVQCKKRDSKFDVFCDPNFLQQSHEDLYTQSSHCAYQHKDYHSAKKFLLQHAEKFGLSSQVENNLKVLEAFETHHEVSSGEKQKKSEKHVHKELCLASVIKDYGINHRSPDLICYMQDDHPVLILKPQKVEIISTHPKVFIWYDMIKENEQEILKRLAEPKLERASVVKNGRLVKTKGRTGQVSWITSTDDPIHDQLSVRFQAVSQLSMQDAEDLQVNNYGIGGHYHQHFDFFWNGTVFDGPCVDQTICGVRNRVATILLYLTDVELGGSTAFIQSKLSVRPKRGAALFWYNMKRDGYGDFDSLHAACPVLVGNKWVANKWIIYGPQLHAYKCLN